MFNNRDSFLILSMTKYGRFLRGRYLGSKYVFANTHYFVGHYVVNIHYILYANNNTEYKNSDVSHFVIRRTSSVLETVREV